MNILFFGGHYWFRGAWFRKQNFAYNLWKNGHRIFYVEESQSIKNLWKSENKLLSITINEIKENLFIIVPPLYFPFYFRSKTIKSIYDYYIFILVKRKVLAVPNLIWVGKTMYSNALKFWRNTNYRVYDLCDDSPLYEIINNNPKGYNIRMKLMLNAIKYSNINIVSAIKLKEKYSKLSLNDFIVIPNGHNISIHDNKYINADIMFNIKKPIIGFVGTLFNFLDIDLIEYIIKNRANYSFVFIGKIENSFPIDRLKKYGNFYHLGRKDKDLIPAYIKQFDACINPFKKHEVNDSVNPLKVFEYLACKKPVVSTDMYSLSKEDIAKYIEFASTKEIFLNNLDYIVLNKKQMEIDVNDIEKYNWENLFGKLVNEIKDKHNLTL